MSDAMADTHRALLRQMFDAAVAAAQPALCLPRYLPPPPMGRTVVIGAGKASAAMARCNAVSTSGYSRALTPFRLSPVSTLMVTEAV